jgi:inner membrane protein YidH
MSAREPDPPAEVDPRWTLANERTFLAWSRTALALIAGGIAAVKLADFEHGAVRWIVAAPPLVGGTVLAGQAAGRFRRYEAAMRAHRPLPVGRSLGVLGVGLAVYGVVVLVAVVLDG